MRNFINKIKSKFQKATVTAKVAVENKRAEGYIDTAVKIIIGVVIGGVILAGLYTLFNTTVIPTLTSKIGEMFSYTGT
jgi:uncharacterized membrane protein